MSGEVVFSAQAYCKMMLHCAKYPHCAVNGVLLAKATGSKSSEITFVDAIPLFHICLNVTPMYEIALSQIDIMAQSQGLVIAGYYSAEENFKDSFGELGQRIASKIGEFHSSACWVMVDNRGFPSIYDGHKSKQLPVTIITSSEGKWSKKKDAVGVVVSDDALDKAEALIAEKKTEIVDFDNHLDNLKLDWRNPKINSMINGC